MSLSSHGELLHVVRQRQVVGEPATVILATFKVSKLLQASSTVRSLKLKVKSLERTDAERVLVLGPSQFGIISKNDKLIALQQTLRKLDDFLEMRKIGRLDVQIFDLPANSHKIFAAIEQVKPAEIRGDMSWSDLTDESRPKDVDSLIAIERILRTADISNLVRERPVYMFSKSGSAKMTQRELVVDITEIGRIAKVNILKKPWLLSEVTRIVDFRIMAHVIHDRQHSQNDISINLHTDTVLSSEFENFVNVMDANRAIFPNVELDLAELKAYPDIAKLAIKRLNEIGAKIIVDGISAGHLIAKAEPLPPISGAYKFDWRNVWKLDSSKFDALMVAKQIKQQLDRLGRENCVLLHCHLPNVIENGLKLGFTQLEGFEIAKYLAGKPKIKMSPVTETPKSTMPKPVQSKVGPLKSATAKIVR